MEPMVQQADRYQRVGYNVNSAPAGWAIFRIEDIFNFLGGYIQLHHVFLHFEEQSYNHGSAVSSHGHLLRHTIIDGFDFVFRDCRRRKSKYSPERPGTLAFVAEERVHGFKQ